ncbi:MAG: MerR family transcriptional regulator [Rhodospirillales bacterium]|nr:MerR family transcriptional regulator [Rhodospirillales bacterium]
MFRIGEFAHIAQVSTRLLRYYDQLGLLEPVRIEPETGYRYYSAKQLPRLNRILALKELGLTLEQVRAMLARDLPAAELRGMLALRMADVQQTLMAEQQKLRQIEARIQQLDELGAQTVDDVVLKSIDARPFLASRQILEGMDEAIALLQTATAKTRESLVSLGRVTGFLLS